MIIENNGRCVPLLPYSLHSALPTLSSRPQKDNRKRRKKRKNSNTRFIRPRACSQRPTTCTTEAPELTQRGRNSNNNSNGPVHNDNNDNATKNNYCQSFSISKSVWILHSTSQTLPYLLYSRNSRTADEGDCRSAENIALVNRYLGEYRYFSRKNPLWDPTLENRLLIEKFSR